jgi:hypothetical protein
MADIDCRGEPVDEVGDCERECVSRSPATVEAEDDRTGATGWPPML